MKTLSFLLVMAVIPRLFCFANAFDELTAGDASSRSAAQLYVKYCSSCHGEDGQAKTRKAKFNHARNIADLTWQNEVGDERIFNSIMNGRNVRGNMPAFSRKLSEQEVDSLVTYVRSLKK